MKQPTATHQRILSAICAYIDQHGAPPTVRELAAACGVGSTTMHFHLGKMADAGLIVIEHYQARGIRVLRQHNGSDAAD